MRKLFITLAFTLNMFCVNAQKLIADETTLTELKASVKITTSNEAIFSLLLKHFNAEVTKYSVSIKKDRQGAYKEYTVPFKTAELPKIIQFFKELNAKAK